MTMNMQQSNYYSTSGQFFYPEQPFFQKRMRFHQRCHIDSKAISDFYLIEFQQTDSPIWVIPDGCIDILFECNPNNPNARICGSTLNTHDVPMLANTPYFGIRFLPGIMPNFIEASATTMINQCIDFNTLVSGGTEIVERIVFAPKIDLKIDIFLAYFTATLNRKLASTTEFILYLLLHQPHSFKIKELEKLTGYCYRHIQRTFKHDTGMSIKSLACILRFQSAIHALNLPQQPSLAALTYALGYNDQAHFHKEFKRFSNMSPTHFIKYLDSYH